MSAIMRLRRGEPFDVRRVDGAEHRACMELVHGVYVASGYIEPCADGVRARQWDATGQTFGAYKGGELAGCVTLVEDGALGLPSEALYPEIAALRRHDGLLCEVTNLAIAPQYRRSRALYDLLVALFRRGVQVGYTCGIVAVTGEVSILGSSRPVQTGPGSSLRAGTSTRRGRLLMGTACW